MPGDADQGYGDATQSSLVEGLVWPDVPVAGYRQSALPSGLTKAASKSVTARPIAL